nr:hypothetical protein TetV2_00066 [Oceanusvirus sp.]
MPPRISVSPAISSAVGRAVGLSRPTALAAPVKPPPPPPPPPLRPPSHSHRDKKIIKMDVTGHGVFEPVELTDTGDLRDLLMAAGAAGLREAVSSANAAPREGTPVLRRLEALCERKYYLLRRVR